MKDFNRDEVLKLIKYFILDVSNKSERLYLVYIVMLSQLYLYIYIYVIIIQVFKLIYLFLNSLYYLNNSEIFSLI